MTLNLIKYLDHMMKCVFSLDEKDYSDIDARLKLFLNGWSAIQNYQGDIVRFPDSEKSKSNIYPYKYFEVIKKKGDFNYREDERDNEIQLYLSVGWRDEHAKKCAFDDEAIIVLMITGRDVLSGNYLVHAEIHNFAGSPLQIFFRNKLVTDFMDTVKEKQLFRMVTKRIPKDKIWIEDMKKFL